MKVAEVKWLIIVCIIPTPPLESDKDASKEKELDIEKTSQGKKVDKDAPMRKEPDEDKLLIHKNDLVRGVIDKAQFAEYGLLHTVHELYGSNTASALLSALSRLFTSFLLASQLWS